MKCVKQQYFPRCMKKDGGFFPARYFSCVRCFFWLPVYFSPKKPKQTSTNKKQFASAHCNPEFVRYYCFCHECFLLMLYSWCISERVVKLCGEREGRTRNSPEIPKSSRDLMVPSIYRLVNKVRINEAIHLNKFRNIVSWQHPSLNAAYRGWWEYVLLGDLDLLETPGY